MRESRGVLKKREQRTDDADQVKTAARHDYLPGFAGAPLIFYNRLQPDSRLKVVILNGRGARSAAQVVGQYDVSFCQTAAPAVEGAQSE